MKKKIAIIGGGTAGLFLAAFLNKEKFEISIYEKNKTLGRKFLVAGNGGFNLTHSEDISLFKNKYKPPLFLEKVLESFTNNDLRNWLSQIGIQTYVGSSGRVYPIKGIKPIEVLKSIEAHLIRNDVKFCFNKLLTGWNGKNVIEFNSSEIITTDYTIFALGGASWEVTGSDGFWLNLFSDKNIETIPFRASNCAFKINWEKEFIRRNEGIPLKNISISINNTVQKGEAVITNFGIEGNAVYGLSSAIQAELTSKNKAEIFIDFKPTLSLEKIIEKISESPQNKTKTLKEKIKLSTTTIDLLKIRLKKEEFLEPKRLANFIKTFPITLEGAAPINEAISTTGGVCLNAIDENFELKQAKNNFCIGEMLDWDAPTGGYLIQACASMSVYLARRMNNYFL